jgi:hypothetical protein
MAAIDDLQTALLERYNIDEPGDGSVFAAVARVREEGAAAIPVLEHELRERTFYHWHERIWEAFANLSNGEPEGLAAKSYNELKALAKARGIAFVGLTKAALVEALTEEDSPAEPTA